MFSTIEHLDRQLLLLINRGHTSFLDSFMWRVTEVWTWLPLFVLLTVLIAWLYRRRAWVAVVLVALTIGMSDYVASGIIKPRVARYRPSRNLEIQDDLHLHVRGDGSVYRGGQYGFVSSHAANFFALSVLMIYMLKPLLKRRWLCIFFFLWASLIAYSRMYLGVHYPADILGGAIVGVVCASVVCWINQQTNWLRTDADTSN